MTALTGSVKRPALRRSPSTVALLAVAALAWAGFVAVTRHMGNVTGTMGLSIGAFVGMWGLMMTAMMLPAVAPVATLYVRTINAGRARRLTLFVGGYLLIWAAVGVPAFAASRLVDHFAGTETAVRVVAVTVLLAAGVYQLTPLKAVCLRHCRSPLAQLLHYGNVKGRTRDLKVSAHHAGYCLGCCWALMALFLAFGIMSVWAMLGLTALVVGEKLLPQGDRIGRAAGVVFLLLATAIAASPTVAHALLPAVSHGPMMSGM